MKKFSRTTLGILGLAMIAQSGLQASTVGVGAVSAPGAAGYYLLYATSVATGSCLSNTANGGPSATSTFGSVTEGQSVAYASVNMEAATVYASYLADGTGNVGGCGSAGQGEASLIYDFAVVAPAGSTNSFVPILISGTSSLFYNPNGGNGQTVILASTPPLGGVPGQGGSSVQTLTFKCSGADESGCGSQQYQISMSAPVLTGNATGSGQIQLEAVAAGNATGSDYAQIDPFIQIDPTFLAANPGYSIVVSAGVGNSLAASSVPEPASLALTGAAVLGLAGVRRKRSWNR